MKKKLFVPVVLLAAAVAGLAACQQAGGESGPVTISKDSLVRRGSYLVNAMGCNDCHTPKIMTAQGPVLDSARLLSGYRAGMPLPPADKGVLKNGWALFFGDGTAMISPLGTAFAANITSDQTGIGNWSYQQFKTAFTKGKWKGLENNRNLLPPMPWEAFRHLKEEDVKAIYEFLQSTTPVSNLVPASIVAEPAAPPAGKQMADQ